MHVFDIHSHARTHTTEQAHLITQQKHKTMSMFMFVVGFCFALESYVVCLKLGIVFIFVL